MLKFLLSNTSNDLREMMLNNEREKVFKMTYNNARGLGEREGSSSPLFFPASEL